MILVAMLSIVRLALLAGYCVLVATGYGWWGVPLLCVFVVGAGCKPPAAYLTPKAGGQP